MIWFEELQTRKKISKIFYRYEKTFLENERRDKEQFLDLAENPYVFVFNINDEDNNIGYVVIWELDNYYFLEHFEVFEEFRNRKYGERIIEALQEKFGKIILEAQPYFVSEIAERRLNFYQRNGFEVVDKGYIQPSYGEGKSSVNLFLMANIQPDDLYKTIKNIYEIVYNKKAD